ncbi:response regulator transcription factor [Candidatus Poribacteria bacterium]|jgi:two-component system, NarL family, response regulator NreC|nr:response regulator transcription factor [Candidatus Poribacteria bacterium]MBT5709708.1 response regulator transcription factor [Candidatus Poribacteria bacterium]MBT7101557.1 response regulator transcription factor [Candidatus Poribacteria bacterium]MBT7807614.1 response regulator transcription factor [Candidatus Poribacteria bacterium]
MPIRIAIADDHALLRRGLRVLLELEPDIEVVGEATNGTEVIDLAENQRPDIMLLDLTMPALRGVDAIPEVRRVSPETKILVLTMHHDATYLRQVLRLGAKGYVVKTAADAELVNAVRSVSRGEQYIEPSLSGEALSGLGRPHDERADSGLSDRERDVLYHIADGYTNKETGARLEMPVETVETFRRSVMAKLGLQSRADLVDYALEQGIVERS